MRFDRFETEVEKASDLPVSVTFGDQLDDLALSRREVRLCLGRRLAEKRFKQGSTDVGREERSMCR